MMTACESMPLRYTRRLKVTILHHWQGNDDGLPIDAFAVHEPIQGHDPAPLAPVQLRLLQQRGVIRDTQLKAPDILTTHTHSQQGPAPVRLRLHHAGTS